jgi:hypothetical protein
MIRIPRATLFCAALLSAGGGSLAATGAATLDPTLTAETFGGRAM